MTSSLDQTWLDPQASWNAKLERAQEHLQALRTQVNEYRASEPYTVKPELTDVPQRLAYRLHIWRPQPIKISTIVGDILHNLRAALESVAFELARRSLNGVLTPDQEGLSTFPIKKTSTEFNKFFKGRREGLYSDQSREIFHAFQPFAKLEQAHSLDVALDKDPGSDSEWNLLYRLDKLWNIDKHRRLIPGAWLPKLFWWGSNGETKRRILPGDGTLLDDSILFYIEGKDEGMGEIMHDFNLVLRDDPAFSLAYDVTHDVVQLMEKFTSHIDSIIRKIAWGLATSPKLQ